MRRLCLGQAPQGGLTANSSSGHGDPLCGVRLTPGLAETVLQYKLAHREEGLLLSPYICITCKVSPLHPVARTVVTPPAPACSPLRYPRLNFNVTQKVLDRQISRASEPTACRAALMLRKPEHNTLACSAHVQPMRREALLKALSANAGNGAPKPGTKAQDGVASLYLNFAMALPVTPWKPFPYLPDIWETRICNCKRWGMFEQASDLPHSALSGSGKLRSAFHQAQPGGLLRVRF